MASHGLPQANPYHYKAFRLTINRVGKYPTSWKLKKLPNTGVHALSSPCRTTSLLVLKKSNGWIFHDPREKEDVLSLKMKNKPTASIFLSSSPRLPFLFVLFPHFAFLFFFSFLISPYFPFSPHFLFSLLVIFSPFWRNNHPVNGRKFPPLLPQAKCMALLFPYFFSYFFMTSSPTWLNMSHEFLSYTWPNCEPLLFMPSVTLLWCQVSPFLRCHVASPYLAMCHPTPHVSKNVKSRPLQNSTKFDVAAKFHETISTEKSVSSSEIYKNFGFLPKLQFCHSLGNLDFSGSHTI